VSFIPSAFMSCTKRDYRNSFSVVDFVLGVFLWSSNNAENMILQKIRATLCMSRKICVSKLTIMYHTISYILHSVLFNLFSTYYGVVCSNLTHRLSTQRNATTTSSCSRVNKILNLRPSRSLCILVGAGLPWHIL
jgi:hypothetical protein